MRKNLLEFLFGTAAASEGSRNLGEDVIKLFEEAASEETEQMVANKKPLASALKEIGVTGTVKDGSQSCEICCDNESDYRASVALLSDPDNMHKLAELGWVFTKCGDQAMSNEPACFKLGFIELDMIETPENTQDAESLETVLKNAQKFASTEMDRSDDSLNPVEADVKPGGGKRKGVGKPADGAAPKGKIKDDLSAADLTKSLLDEMTSASAVPAVEAPMGVPARNRFRKKGRKVDEPGNPTC